MANSKLDGILFKEVKGYIKIWHDINYGGNMRNHRKMVGILCCYVIFAVFFTCFVCDGCFGASAAVLSDFEKNVPVDGS